MSCFALIVGGALLFACEIQLFFSFVLGPPLAWAGRGWSVSQATSHCAGDSEGCGQVACERGFLPYWECEYPHLELSRDSWDFCGLMTSTWFSAVVPDVHFFPTSLEVCISPKLNNNLLRILSKVGGPWDHPGLPVLSSVQHALFDLGLFSLKNC